MRGVRTVVTHSRQVGSHSGSGVFTMRRFLLLLTVMVMGLLGLQGTAVATPANPLRPPPIQTVPGHIGLVQYPHFGGCEPTVACFFNESAAVNLAGWARGTLSITFYFTVNGTTYERDNAVCYNTGYCSRTSKTVNSRFLPGTSPTYCVEAAVEQNSIYYFSHSSETKCYNPPRV